MNLDKFRAILTQCQFGEWRILAMPDGEGWYLQVRATETCARTGRPFDWGARKWRLSAHMSKSEVVQTAFMAVLAAVEHETRERFLYQGAPIFGPHHDVDALLSLREDVRAAE